MPAGAHIHQNVGFAEPLLAGTATIGAVDLTRNSAVVTRTATGAAAQVLAANAARKAVTLRNVHATEIIYIAETVGKATAAAGYRLSANESVKFDRSTNAWFAFSAAAGDLVIVEEA